MSDEQAQGTSTERVEGIALTDTSLNPAKTFNLIRRAVREGWKMRPEMMEDAPRVAHQIMNDVQADNRAKVAAIRALVEMDKVNQTDHWNQDRNDRIDSGKPTELAGVVVEIVGMKPR